MIYKYMKTFRYFYLIFVVTRHLDDNDQHRTIHHQDRVYDRVMTNDIFKFLKLVSSLN